MDWCIGNSTLPLFCQIASHENYYKLLEDFNTYDCITEASTVQGAVTMNFPSGENRLTKQQMEEYKNALRETGIFTEADIEKYAKKADMTFKEIIKAEVGNRANYAATQAPKRESTVKAVEAKLQKDHAREMRSGQQTDGRQYDKAETEALSKKFLDNSSVSNENGLTQSQERGETNDNRRVREGTEEATGVSEADGRRYSENAGASQEVKSWDRQSSLAKRRLVEIVDSHIKTSKSQYEVFALVSNIANISKEAFTTAQKRKAIQKVAEQIYSDAMTLHPLLFEDKWRVLGKSLKYDGVIVTTSKSNRNFQEVVAFDSNQIKLTTNKNPTKNKDMRFSTQQTDNITNRHLLANAFEGISKSSIEYEMIQEYKGMIDTLNRPDNDLANINAEIRKIRFTEGERDMEALLRLEASKPICCPSPKINLSMLGNST